MCCYHDFTLLFQVAFSSLYEILCSFTRDYDSIRTKLSNIEDRDKTCLEAALHGVSVLINDEWGQNTPCHVSRMCVFLISPNI